MKNKSDRRMDQCIRLQVFERDEYTCRYCGSKTGPFHADHVYPFSKGGETSISNLVTSCEICNLKKQNKIGLWPKPIGYFSITFRKINVVLYWGITDLVISYFVAIKTNAWVSLIVFIIGLLLSIIGFYLSQVDKK